MSPRAWRSIKSTLVELQCKHRADALIWIIECHYHPRADLSPRKRAIVNQNKLLSRRNTARCFVCFVSTRTLFVQVIPLNGMRLLAESGGHACPNRAHLRTTYWLCSRITAVAAPPIWPVLSIGRSVEQAMDTHRPQIDWSVFNEGPRKSAVSLCPSTNYTLLLLVVSKLIHPIACWRINLSIKLSLGVCGLIGHWACTQRHHRKGKCQWLRCYILLLLVHHRHNQQLIRADAAALLIKDTPPPPAWSWPSSHRDRWLAWHIPAPVSTHHDAMETNLWLI